MYPGDKTLADRISPAKKLWRLGSQDHPSPTRIYKELLALKEENSSGKGKGKGLLDKRLGAETEGRRVKMYLEHNSKSVQCELLFKSNRKSEANSPVIKIDK